MSQVIYDTYRILTRAEAQEYVQILNSLDWEVGQARTPEATGTIKKNEELRASSNDAVKAIVEQIKNKMASHPTLYIDHFVKKLLSPKFNRYKNDGEYKRHGDAAVMGNSVRTDLAMTLWLSHKDLYKGGDLCIEGNDGSYHQFKGDPGTCIVYPCWQPHWVTPVTEGERICMVTWLESMYRNWEERDIQRRFLKALKKMEADPKLEPYGEYFTTFGCIQSKLQRMWVDYA